LYKLADHYRDSDDEEKQQQAVVIYRLCGLEGNLYARRDYASIRIHGQSGNKKITKDVDEGILNYTELAENCDVLLNEDAKINGEHQLKIESAYELALVYIQKSEFIKAVEWLVKASHSCYSKIDKQWAGYSSAQYALAAIYEEGKVGVPKDETSAVGLYEAAAKGILENGVYMRAKSHACFRLGEIYEQGLFGEKKSLQQSLTFYKFASLCKDFPLPNAALKVVMLAEDKVEAQEYFKKANELKADKNSQLYKDAEASLKRF
jgi:TPR repeat protein